MDNKEPSLENKTVESIPAVTIRFAGDSKKRDSAEWF